MSVMWLATIAVFVLLVSVLGAPFIAEIPFWLVAGWFFFLKRTLPEVRPDWSSIGLATLSALLLLAAVHRTGCKVVQRARQSMRDEHPNAANTGSPADFPHVWRFRWSILCIAALLLCFTSGVSVVGAIHHVVWMLSSPGSMLTEHGFDAVARATSRNHLQGIGIAVDNCADRSGGDLPAGGTFDTGGRPMHSVMATLLPHLEQQPLFDTIDFARPWNDVANSSVFRTRVPNFRFPEGAQNPEWSDSPDAFAMANYAPNIRVFPLGTAKARAHVTDGLSNTLFFGEVARGLKPWGDPLNARDPTIGLNHSREGFSSLYSGGKIVQFVLGDGSVKGIHTDIDPQALRALSTPDGGESEFEKP